MISGRLCLQNADLLLIVIIRSCMIMLVDGNICHISSILKGYCNKIYKHKSHFFFSSRLQSFMLHGYCTSLLIKIYVQWLVHWDWLLKTFVSSTSMTVTCAAFFAMVVLYSFSHLGHFWWRRAWLPALKSLMSSTSLQNFCQIDELPWVEF